MPHLDYSTNLFPRLNPGYNCRVFIYNPVSNVYIWIMSLMGEIGNVFITLSTTVQ